MVNEELGAMSIASCIRVCVQASASGICKLVLPVHQKRSLL
jgi:hypothetical protein